MNFNSLSELDKKVVEIANELHPSDLEIIFLSGSFVSGKVTNLSDVDYTVVTKNPYKHPMFIWKLFYLEGILRLVSIAFFSIDDFHLSKELIDDEDYLWTKGMMPNTRFVYGNKELFNKICDFYSDLTYTRLPKPKTVHKSFGKLLELLARIKKWEIKNNFVEMAYYGQKLAEHARRLVIEINGPISLTTENEWLTGHFHLPNLPEDFELLYTKAACLDLTGISMKEYKETCEKLVFNTANFLRSNEAKLDNLTKQLVNDENIDAFIRLN